MTKNEILAVLYEMKADFESEIIPLRCKAGFCAWLISYGLIKTITHQLILDELQKELLKPCLKTIYWYNSYLDSKSFDISIQPRINHLKATIARLENEIKNEKL